MKTFILKYRNALLLGYVVINLSLFAQNDVSSSFRFLTQNPDAYSHSMADSDLIPFTAGSVYNNMSASVFNQNKMEVGFSYLGEHLIDNRITLYGIGDVGVGKLGGKFLYLFTKDNDFSGSGFSTLYNAFNGGLSYAVPVDKLIKKLKIPLSISAGMSFVTETVLDQTEYAFLFDTGITAAFLKNKLFAAISFNDYGIGHGSTSVPFSASMGVKYHVQELHKLKGMKQFDLFTTFKYSIDSLLVNSMALGIDFQFLKRYSIRMGGRFDLASSSSTYNASYNFGMGIKLPIFEIDLSFAPAYTYNMQFIASIKGYIGGDRIKKGPKRLTPDQILKLSIKEIIILARRAIKNNDIEYAKLLVKYGIILAPDNDEILELLDLLSYEDKVPDHITAQN